MTVALPLPPRIAARKRVAEVLLAQTDPAVRAIGKELQQKIENDIAVRLRDRVLLLQEMASKFFPGAIRRNQAQCVVDIINRYRNGPDWERDTGKSQITYRSTARGFAWAILRTLDRSLSIATVERALIIEIPKESRCKSPPL